VHQNNPVALPQCDDGALVDGADDEPEHPRAQIGEAQQGAIDRRAAGD
jgi:hypothetical protein